MPAPVSRPMPRPHNGGQQRVAMSGSTAPRSTTESTSSGGLAGFFGGRTDYRTFTPGTVADTTTAANQQRIRTRVGEIDNRANATMQGAAPASAAQIATGPQDQFRQEQMGLVGMLRDQANGVGPSLAQSQLEMGADRGMKQALSLQASARGVNPAVAAKNAANAQAQIAQGAAGDAARLRLEEQLGARAALAGVVGQGRSQDIGLATDQAGLNQQTALTNQSIDQQTQATNLAAGIQQQQQRDDLVREYLTLGMSMDQARQQAEIQQRQFEAGLLAQQEAARHGIASQNGAQQTQLAGAVIGAAARAAAAASDERMKTDIKPGEGAIEEFLGGLGVHEYEYSDEHKDNPLAGEGRFVSPMAQEIEKTKLGKSLVRRDEDGNKIVDYGKGFGLMLAIMTKQQREIGQLKELAGKPGLLGAIARGRAN